MSTLERIQELRRRRLGRYQDLVRASCNGTFIDDDLRELDEIALLLGKTDRALADDLNAATRFCTLTRQVTDAENQKPDAEAQADRIRQRIESLSKERNAMGAPRRENHEATREYNNKRSQIEGEITKLKDDHRAARKPIGRAEVAGRQLDQLIAANPWLGGKAR